MTDEELRELVSAARELLQPRLERSEPLRRAVELVGRWLIEESRRAEAASTETTEAAESQSASPFQSRPSVPAPDSPAAAPAPARRPGVTVPLNLGSEAVHVTVSPAGDGLPAPRPALPDSGEDAGVVAYVPHEAYEEPEEAEIDLGLVEQRCRLKAESCRLFIDRRAATGDPVAEAPFVERMDEMIAQAKAMPNCFLWVFWRERTQPEDESLRTLAACYDALAETASLMRRVDDLGDRLRSSEVREAMQLLAEADSALRIALEPTWLTSPDVDQDEVHQWIRRESDARRIYVPRYMKLDDPADPDDAPDVIEQAIERRGEIEDHASRLKRIDEGFKKVRYHVDQLEHGDGPFDRHHYAKIAEAIEGLDALGVPPTDRRFRGVLDPETIATFPVEARESNAVAAVLGSVAEWRESNASAESEPEPDDAGEGSRWSDRVHEARALLRGRAAVVVGGEPRNDAIARIRDAFDLDSVEWVRLSEHGSGDPMRAPIMRPETAVVFVLIKLAGHLHTEEANGYARDAGIPAVYLKAGYNPEQIADAVLQQASEQLGAAAGATSQ